MEAARHESFERKAQARHDGRVKRRKPLIEEWEVEQWQLHRRKGLVNGDGRADPDTHELVVEPLARRQRVGLELDGNGGLLVAGNNPNWPSFATISRNVVG